MSLLKGWRPTWREPMVNSMMISWRAVQSRLSSDPWSLPCHTSMHHYWSARSLALETFLELLQVKARPLRWNLCWKQYNLACAMAIDNLHDNQFKTYLLGSDICAENLLLIDTDDGDWSKIFREVSWSWRFQGNIFSPAFIFCLFVC